MADPYKGDGHVTYFTPDGGTRTKISGPSRTWELTRQASSIDAAHRDNPSFKLGATPEKSMTLAGLDVAGGAFAAALEEDDIGVIEDFPEGEVVGKRVLEYDVRVNQVTLGSEIGAAATWSVQFDITSTIVPGTVSA